jgi:hypothetical protein
VEARLNARHPQDERTSPSAVRLREARLRSENSLLLEFILIFQLVLDLALMWERFLVERELLNLPSEIGNSLAEEQIINEVITLLISTTTALYLLAFPLYYLLQNLACLAKAHEEITANSTPVPLTIDPLRSVLALQPG